MNSNSTVFNISKKVNNFVDRGWTISKEIVQLTDGGMAIRIFAEAGKKNLLLAVIKKGVE